MAETRDIARVAALLGAERGFEAGIVAEALDKLGRIGQRWPAVDVGGVHARSINPDTVSTLTRNIVNVLLTIGGKARGGLALMPLAQGRA